MSITTPASVGTPAGGSSVVPGWMGQAACRGHADLPWTTDTRDTPAADVMLMAAICGACPVIASCWTYAAAEDITGGYWAGIDRDVITTRTSRTKSRTRRAA